MRKPFEKTCENCGKKYTQSNLTKYCSTKCYHIVQKIERQEAKNPMWKGGISGGYAYRITKENLIQKCCLCEATKFLCVHHKNENRKDNRLENLMIVCKSCHAKIHDIQRNINHKKDGI